MKPYRHIILIVSLLCFTVAINARPARGGISIVSQPDGSSFTLITYGDEFHHVCKTTDGCAVICDLDGWWCYACCDKDGKKTSSGWRVGTPAPAEAISASKALLQMPVQAYEKMQTARSLQRDSAPLLARIQDMQGTKTGETATHKHGIVLLAAFKDTQFEFTKQHFVDLLTLKGYSYGGATGCAKEYFESQFGNSFIFDFDVSEIITLSQNRSYYGANDAGGSDRAPEEMVIEACQVAAAQGIDFSIYDQDNDGEVDNVFVIFAGDDEADYPDDMRKQDCIWSHAWYIRDGAGKHLTINGKTINRYACTSEMSRAGRNRVLTGIGTFCHEYSHTFGLPDYYDTDYEKSHGMSASLWGITALMDSGNHNNSGNTPPYFNAIDREILGIGQPERIESNGTYSLTPIGEGGSYYRIDTDNNDEYYLLECRHSSGWDKYIGGNGLLIYHIDKSDRSTGISDMFNKELTASERWQNYNEVNAYPQHQCADLVEADGRNDKFSSYELYARSMASVSGIFFPQNGATSFSADSRPPMKFWSGDKPQISISEIRKDGKNISFYVSGFEGILPRVKVEKEVIFQNAAIISFSTGKEFTDATAKISWGETDKSKESKTLKPYEPGKFCLILENLKPSVSYDVTISIETQSGTGKETNVSFLTSRANSSTYPYISFKSVDRKADGSFSPGCKIPLMVWNSVNAAEIKWFFNGKSIERGPDGFFTPETDGELKAEIVWKDGGEDIIVKKIIIND